jgi:hypothetical protein
LTLALVGFSQPVQAEIPTGNLNNNILTYGLTTSGLYPTSQWMAEGNQVSAVLGHSAATAGDVNGDGYEDVIVGAYPYDVISGTTVLTDAGRVYVYYGSLTGLSATPDWIVEGDQAGDNLGGSVGTAGDVNGDGYDDVIIAACPYDVITGTTVLTDAGRVYIYYGSAAGLSTTPDWTADGDQEGGMFGSRVATAGNVNGDTYDDVIIGAYKYDHGHTDEGRVYVYHGSSSGPGATAAWMAESDQDNTYFGLRVGTAGDVNGDGYDEVIVAAPIYDNGTFNEGAIFVWYGSNTGLGDNGTPANAGWMAESDHWGFNFGYGVSTAGDVNGDGYDDVIAGSHLYNLGGTIGQGAAFGWYGSAAGLGPNGNFTNADWTVVGDQTNGYLGYTVANAGDVNGDGYDDAIVGAHGYDNGETDEGRAYVYHGWACRAQIDGESTVYDMVQNGVDASTSVTDVVKVSGYCPGTSSRAGLTQGVYLSKTVTIQGGYLPDFSNVPDPDAYPTTLDALGEGRVLYVTGDISPTIEGLRITGGDAAGLGGLPWTGDAGGGVYVYTATATISNCVVYSNTASTTDRGFGGGVLLLESPATLSDNWIISNTASTANYGEGGGLFLRESDATLSGNTVQGNIAGAGGNGNGGGLYISHGNSTLSGNWILSNTASTTNRGDGGGLRVDLEGGGDSLTLTGNTVQGNIGSTADEGYGGGINIGAGPATLTGNTVQGNTASTVGDGYGGGLRLGWPENVALSGNTIISNTATLDSGSVGQGGGLWVAYSGPFTLTNNLVADNHANTEGSGLWFDGESWQSTAGRLLHTTIADNAASGGSGQGVYVGDHTTLAFTNTIIAGHHSVGITATTDSTVTLEATLWHGNGADTGGGGTVISSTNVTRRPPHRAQARSRRRRGLAVGLPATSAAQLLAALPSTF